MTPNTSVNQLCEQSIDLDIALQTHLSTHLIILIHIQTHITIGHYHIIGCLQCIFLTTSHITKKEINQNKKTDSFNINTVPKMESLSRQLR